MVTWMSRFMLENVKVYDHLLLQSVKHCHLMGLSIIADFLKVIVMLFDNVTQVISDDV